MSNRHKRDSALVETPTGHEGVYQDDLDGMLGHVGREHIYAERTMNVTPDAIEALFNQRVWKDGAGAWDGVAVATNVYLGKVEPGTFWLVEMLNIAQGLPASVGFAYVMEGVGVTSYARRARATMDAGGAFVMFNPPVFVGGGDVFVRCVQNAAAADTVVVTAQVRVVSKS